NVLNGFHGIIIIIGLTGIVNGTVSGRVSGTGSRRVRTTVVARNGTASLTIV
ncbi:7902_t:CDS:2, partial [Diversispora eburnea]